MAEQEKFEVGQWVWVHHAKAWGRIVSDESKTTDWKQFFRVEGLDINRCAFTGVFSGEDLYPNPHVSIPPKPKKTVTKEAKVLTRTPNRDYDDECVMCCVPSKAFNVRCTYDIEEECGRSSA